MIDIQKAKQVIFSKRDDQIIKDPNQSLNITIDEESR